ncbi:MAG: 2,4-dihydroxyhept-2-ene-1,7-dioic acid aldolase [Rhodobacteraceae bacterium]|nr:2,4-dihydroxyhept-2-ene-1,7-dioic acid aldolase [Paracoccaceae bacterium]
MASDDIKNPVKLKLLAGQKTAGAFLQIPHSIPTEIFSQAGFDWLIIDMEHAAGDMGNLLGQMQAISGTGTVPFVRPPWNDDVWIKRILDTGAQGVLVPYVNTGAEAASAVAACRYPPAGVRGVAGSTRAARYGKNIKAYLESANREIIVIVAIETREAIDNLDDILAVDDLDGVFIGPMDLATNLGHLGNPGHEDVQAAFTEIEGKVLASDKFLGTLTTTWERTQECFAKGYQWLIVMQDGTALVKAANEMAGRFRDEYGDGQWQFMTF